MKFKRKTLKAFLFNLLAIAQLFVCPICNLFVTTCNLLLLFNVHDLFIIYYNTHTTNIIDDDFESIFKYE